MFKHIREQADDASYLLASERGPCADAAEWGVHQRFSCKMSLAPTASISIIAGNSSPGIEPIAVNVFLQKTLSCSFTVRNRHLQMLLAEKGQDTPVLDHVESRQRPASRRRIARRSSARASPSMSSCLRTCTSIRVYWFECLVE